MQCNWPRSKLPRKEPQMLMMQRQTRYGIQQKSIGSNNHITTDSSTKLSNNNRVTGKLILKLVLQCKRETKERTEKERKEAFIAGTGGKHPLKGTKENQGALFGIDRGALKGAPNDVLTADWGGVGARAKSRRFNFRDLPEGRNQC